MSNIDIDKLQSSPETAVKHGDKYYKAELENEKTGEKTYTVRPNFAVENKDKKLTVHPAFLAEFFRLTENIVYLRNNALGTEIRYIYQNGVYVQINNNDLDKILLDYVAKFKFSLQTVHTVANARELIDKKSEKIVHNKMNEAEEYINFRNGLLNIYNMKLCPHSPDIFSTIQIPCDWKNENTLTPVFDRFIGTFTENNKQKAQLLLEYIGAVISNIYGYRFKKCMFLVGSGDSGKSLISALINRLIGSENSSERSLKRMSDKFGETAVYMKRFVFSGDLSFMKIDQMDRFKELTGGDTISVEFKNQEPFDYQFRG
ncbi:MAG: DUF5906 domain-containing protein, partial [Oscillospiraceae bacterium]|nr:DUF5906 domain-containing protein [Oscillospiraceae bacterium]